MNVGFEISVLYEVNSHLGTLNPSTFSLLLFAGCLDKLMDLKDAYTHWVTLGLTEHKQIKKTEGDTSKTGCDRKKEVTKTFDEGIYVKEGKVFYLFMF